MSYYISSMIGIRTGGVFADAVDMDDLGSRVSQVVRRFRAEEKSIDIPDDLGKCISDELVAHKGSYVVIAGVFNNWNAEAVAEFARELSREFQTEVMQMTWDEERESVDAAEVWLAGESVAQIHENTIGRMLRRIDG